jgi:hypothetical protein
LYLEGEFNRNIAERSILSLKLSQTRGGMVLSAKVQTRAKL